MEVGPVLRDIAGSWQPQGNYFHAACYVRLDQNARDTCPLDAGDYLLVQAGEAWHLHLSGRWGNAFVSGYPGLAFPVRDGFTTRVTLTIGRLQVGVLNEAGDSAIPGAFVTLYCSREDIGGGIIPDPTCEGDEWGWNEAADPTGIATFYLGPGEYHIRVSGRGGHGEDKYLYHIRIAAGEDDRIDVNYP
jgi:hypothetical protein